MAVYQNELIALFRPVNQPSLALSFCALCFQSRVPSRFMLIGYVAVSCGPIIAFVFLSESECVGPGAVGRARLLKINAGWFLNFLSFQGLLAGLSPPL